MDQPKQEAPVVDISIYTVQEKVHDVRDISGTTTKTSEFTLLRNGLKCACHRQPRREVVKAIVTGKDDIDLQIVACSTICSRAKIMAQGELAFFTQSCEVIPGKYPLANLSFKTADIAGSDFQIKT